MCGHKLCWWIINLMNNLTIVITSVTTCTMCIHCINYQKLILYIVYCIGGTSESCELRSWNFSPGGQIGPIKRVPPSYEGILVPEGGALLEPHSWG